MPIDKNAGASGHSWNGRHLAALLGANLALALGPWSVRLADSGPVAAGFWRLFLPLPFLFLFARMNRQQIAGFPRHLWLVIAGAGLFFAADLAAWHIGIGMTRLGNATLFGNSGSLLLMLWGVIAMRRAPTRFETTAILAAFTGAAILFGRSLEISHATLVGDLFCLLAGFFYTFYILLLQGARARLGNWALLFWSCVAGLPLLLAIAFALGEPVWPRHWGALVALALGSQVIGQGLLVYALRHFSPLIVGMALLTQPAVSALYGWMVFGEALLPLDMLGMALVAAALVIARAGGRR
ncbi:MAG: DMT family transporter [Novosphingobium sp.]|nr:DMT family transporter [Novosphingobium sp.]